MDIKANHLRLTGACLLDSNVNKLHKTYALGMMHKQQFIELSSGMLPKYLGYNSNPYPNFALGSYSITLGYPEFWVPNLRSSVHQYFYC